MNNFGFIVLFVGLVCLFGEANARCDGGIAPFPREIRLGDWRDCSSMSCPPHYGCAITDEDEFICCPGKPVSAPPVLPTASPNCTCNRTCSNGYTARAVTSCCDPHPYLTGKKGHYECAPNNIAIGSCTGVQCQFEASCLGRFNPSECCGFECLEQDSSGTESIQDDDICGIPNAYLPEMEKVACEEISVANWFYDPQSISCVNRANQNLQSGECIGMHVQRFNTSQQCQDACINVYKDACLMPIQKSTCAALDPSFGYSRSLKKCVSFNHGGCAPNNKNRFNTQEECDSTCQVCNSTNGRQYNPGEFYPSPYDRCQICVCSDRGLPDHCLDVKCVAPVCSSDETLKMNLETCCDYECEKDAILSTWGIIGIGALLIFIIIVLVLVICFVCCFGGGGGKSSSSKDSEKNENSDTESNKDYKHEDDQTKLED